jgi:hypothetical protein
MEVWWVSIAGSSWLAQLELRGLGSWRRAATTTRGRPRRCPSPRRAQRGRRTSRVDRTSCSSTPTSTERMCWVPRAMTSSSPRTSTGWRRRDCDAPRRGPRARSARRPGHRCSRPRTRPPTGCWATSSMTPPPIGTTSPRRCKPRATRPHRSARPTTPNGRSLGRTSHHLPTNGSPASGSITSSKSSTATSTPGDGTRRTRASSGTPTCSRPTRSRSRGLAQHPHR